MNCSPWLVPSSPPYLQRGLQTRRPAAAAAARVWGGGGGGGGGLGAGVVGAGKGKGKGEVGAGAAARGAGGPAWPVGPAATTHPTTPTHPLPGPLLQSDLALHACCMPAAPAPAQALRATQAGQGGGGEGRATHTQAPGSGDGAVVWEFLGQGCSPAAPLARGRVPTSGGITAWSLLQVAIPFSCACMYNVRQSQPVPCCHYCPPCCSPGVLPGVLGSAPSRGPWPLAR